MYLNYIFIGWGVGGSCFLSVCMHGFHWVPGIIIIMLMSVIFFLSVP